MESTRDRIQLSQRRPMVQRLMGLVLPTSSLVVKIPTALDLENLPVASTMMELEPASLPEVSKKMALEQAVPSYSLVEMNMLVPIQQQCCCDRPIHCPNRRLDPMHLARLRTQWTLACRLDLRIQPQLARFG